MHIITRKRIIEAERKHPDCAGALRGWYRVMKRGRFANFAELKSAFNSVDKAGNLYVFNVGGNKLRIIVAVHFNTGRAYIRNILTHTEYDQEKW